MQYLLAEERNAAKEEAVSPVDADLVTGPGEAVVAASPAQIALALQMIPTIANTEVARENARTSGVNVDVSAATVGNKYVYCHRGGHGPDFCSIAYRFIPGTSGPSLLARKRLGKG